MTAILKRLKTEGLGTTDILKLAELFSDTNKSIHQQTTQRAKHDKEHDILHCHPDELYTGQIESGEIKPEQRVGADCPPSPFPSKLLLTPLPCSKFHFSDSQ
jgi:hypothetical protein